VSAHGSDATAELGVPIEEAGVRRGRRGRRLVRWFAALALVLAAAGVVVALTNPFGGGGPARAGVSDNGAATSLATVTEGPLASQTQVSGTLGYAGSYSVVNNATGAATWLPGGGQVLGRGQVLYRVAGEPVVLLYGSTPAYRLLKYGMTGADVQQLNANLVALGYATSSALDPTSHYFSAETKYALELLQHALGVKQTGKLALGQAVFLPAALRITHVMATLGTTLQPGGIVAQATSIRRQVTVNLDAGSLDQAPVQVQITTARVTHALVVPVAALLALAGGGYAVETVDARGVHHLVAVTAGLFDDAHGLVQVSGSLSAGEQVVVPST
jgi:hypothetical protein